MSPRARRLVTVAVLLLGSALIVASRLHSYDLPPDVDVSLGQVVGHELLQGRTLYTEIWDHRPPLTYLGYAAAELVTGWGDAQLLLLGASLAVLTLLGVWTAGAAFGLPAAGVAAAFWVLLQADMATEAQHPNAEAFLNALLVWAFAALVHRRTRWAPTALWTAATLAKANAIVYPALFALVRLVTARRRGPAVRDVAAWVAVGAAGWLAVAAWFGLQGRLDHFVNAVFAYPAYYQQQPWKALVAGLFPSLALNRVLLGAAPAAALSAVALLLSGPPRERRLLGAALVATWLAVTLPGRFVPHYYQLYLPFLAVGAGWGFAALARRSGTAARVAAAIALTAAFGLQLPGYAVDDAAWVRRAKGENAERYVAQMRATRVVRETLPDSGTLYQLGSQPAYYVATRRSPPTGVLFLNHMCQGLEGRPNPVAGRLTAMALSDLERSPPDLVVRDSAFARLCPDHPIHDWVDDRYAVSPTLTSSGRAQVLLPRDGEEVP